MAGNNRRRLVVLLREVVEVSRDRKARYTEEYINTLESALFEFMLREYPDEQVTFMHGNDHFVMSLEEAR